ncbi:helix-turn-helix transcriptional regulator [Streptomyces sp. NPDC004532]|uniref:helix-turn-helix transcriptional regulator n=1 Tax=Streptomyces sp. NPDC091299 TaxID=3155302 RepID=UPI00343E7B14
MPRPAKIPAPPPAGCLWTPAAARHIGLSVSTLYTYKNQGKAPDGCFEVARKLAWPIEGLDAWLDAQRKQAPSPARLHETRPAEPRASRRKPARIAA